MAVSLTILATAFQDWTSSDISSYTHTTNTALSSGAVIILGVTTAYPAGGTTPPYLTSITGSSNVTWTWVGTAETVGDTAAEVWYGLVTGTVPISTVFTFTCGSSELVNASSQLYYTASGLDTSFEFLSFQTFFGSVNGGSAVSLTCPNFYAAVGDLVYSLISVDGTNTNTNGASNPPFTTTVNLTKENFQSNNTSFQNTSLSFETVSGSAFVNSSVTWTLGGLSQSGTYAVIYVRFNQTPSQTVNTTSPSVQITSAENGPTITATSNQPVTGLAITSGTATVPGNTIAFDIINNAVINLTGLQISSAVNDLTNFLFSTNVDLTGLGISSGVTSPAVNSTANISISGLQITSLNVVDTVTTQTQLGTAQIITDGGRSRNFAFFDRGQYRIDTAPYTFFDGPFTYQTVNTTTQTLTGVSNISSIHTTTQTQSGVARIQVTTPQTQAGVSKITGTTLQTQGGVSRIDISDEGVNQFGVSRIQITTPQTQVGVSNLRNTTLRTQFGVSNIPAQTTKTQSALSRIQVTTGPQSQAGVSNVRVTTTHTQTGGAFMYGVTSRSSTTFTDITSTLSWTVGSVTLYNPSTIIVGLCHAPATVEHVSWNGILLNNDVTALNTGNTQATLWSLPSETSGASQFGTTGTIVVTFVTPVTGKVAIIEVVDGLNVDFPYSNSSTAIGSNTHPNASVFTNNIYKFIIGVASFEASLSTIPSAVTISPFSLSQYTGTTGASSDAVGGDATYIGPTLGTFSSKITAGTAEKWAFALGVYVFDPAQVQYGISRITATTDQTQTGVSNIRVTTVQTKAGISRITGHTTQPQTGVSNLRVTTQQTQVGASAVQNTTLQTLTSTSDIRNTSPQTQMGLSRISGITIQSQIGVSNIQNFSFQVQFGVTSILNSTQKMQTGVSRITILTPQTIVGISKITGHTPQNQLGATAVQNTTLQIQAGVSTIEQISEQFQEGVSKIQATTRWIQFGDTRIIILSTQTLSGIARVRITSSHTQTGVSKIQLITTQNQVGVANIYATTAKTQVGSADVRVTTVRTETGISRIRHTGIQFTLIGNCRVQVTPPVVTTAGVSRLQRTRTTTLLAVSNLRKTTVQNLNGVSNIGAQVLQTGISRIQITTPRTQTGKSRLQATALVQNFGVARLQITTPQTQAGISNLIRATAVPQTGTARIQNTAARINLGVARIRITNVLNPVGVSRIKVTTVQVQYGSAIIKSSFFGVVNAQTWM